MKPHAALIVALVLAAAPAAAKTTTTLDAIGQNVLDRALPATLAAAPDAIRIDPALRDALLAQPIDGGREKKLYMRFASGRLTFDKAVMGARYRATGSCEDCDYLQPISGHTHPYENPFSVIDLLLASRNSRPSLMATRGGQLYFALPTARSKKLAETEWMEFRYALFANRLQCPAGRPARTPAGGWAAPTPMGRNVELVARAAAHDLQVALYVLDRKDGAFRRLPDYAHDEPMVADGRPVSFDDLNVYETTLLRTLNVIGDPRARIYGPVNERMGELPPQRDKLFEAAIQAPASDDFDDPPAVRGAMRFAADQGSWAMAHWFEALPTTIYLVPFSNPEIPMLPFVSVQMSRDCRSVEFHLGEQDFAPDGVRYQQGWSHPAAGPGSAWHEGWREMATDEMRTTDVVPW